MKNKKTSKIIVEKTIFHEISDAPFTWKKLKNIQFEDGDIITTSYIDRYYSENNSWDKDYFALVTRMVEETDEEFKARQRAVKLEEEDAKNLRKKAYERLKAEFENEK